MMDYGLRNLKYDSDTYSMMDFPGGSDAKESACNAGDPTSIPGLGRSPGEANGNPLQYGEAHGQRSLVGYSPWGHESRIQLSN